MFKRTKMKEQIIRNRIRCKKCGDIIESYYCHDYRECSCGSCAVDGGRQYLRRCFAEQDGFEELSEVIMVKFTEGQRLYERRHEKGYTQIEVAKRAKIALRQYQRFESGERSFTNCSAKQYLAICKVLGFDPYEFFEKYKNIWR